jgi:hypothetical protein
MGFRCQVSGVSGRKTEDRRQKEEVKQEAGKVGGGRRLAGGNGKAEVGMMATRNQYPVSSQPVN